MCGIAGIVKFANFQPLHVDAPHLRAMQHALAHRGPDGSGIFLDPRHNAALLHTRLAIIDLPCGQQPMPNEDATVHVVFNGEIYNHRELRRELESAGHRFATDHSDTEVLVHGWEEWGEQLPARLLGMFAFAIWDRRHDPSSGPRDTLFLARDRMGQKPLFYATLEDGIVFGSTLPSILAWPEVPRRTPRELLGIYLQMGYLPAPHTIYRDISQVMPGHWIRLRRDVLDGQRYWSPTAQIENQKSKIKNPQNDLRTQLTRAVESQLLADVPIACFLSGGIDSSIIAALMQKAVLARGGSPIHTVSVGFAEGAFDETHFAADVARKIGSRHTRLQVDAAGDPLETLRMLMQTSLGQPFADSSILPTYHLSKAVRQIAPVALSGDGADELFAGYDRYRAFTLLSRWGGIARLLPRQSPVGSLAKRERYRRLASAARGETLSGKYTRLVEIFPMPDVAALLGEEASGFEPDAQQLDADPLPLAMFRDQLEYLPGDVLWKVDSASMAHALEVRSPFLDHHIVELANTLDPSHLLAGGVGKAILRQEFAHELPESVRHRSKGFAVPIGDWFRTTLRDATHDILLASQTVNVPFVRRLLEEHDAQTRDHTHRLFSLLMLELWHCEFAASVDA